MKKIVLAYSKAHFDPEVPNRPSGAGFLAHSIYSLLKSKYPLSEVQYFDHLEHNSIKSNTSYPDLFVGISNNIQNFNQKLRSKHSVLFAVNYSATFRRSITKKAKKLNFDKRLLNWEDGISSNLDELNGVTTVLTLGNYSNYLSYVGSGVSPSRVFPISCTLGHDFRAEHKIRLSFGEDILYFPGGISFRKGVAYLRPIAAWLESEAKGRKLRIIGRASDDGLDEYIREIVDQFPKSIVWESQWIERESKIWRENIAKSRFAIFPSFEEGLPASVLDLIESNIPVLYSSACGLDFVSRDVIPNSMDVVDWIELLHSTIIKSDKYLSDLLSDQRRMMGNLPANLSQLEKTLDNIYSESIWPSVCIADGLRAQIPNDSWLLKSGGGFMYIVYEPDLADLPYSVNEVSKMEVMNTEELIAFAITQIDKYWMLRGLVIEHNGRFIAIARDTTNLGLNDSQISTFPANLNLYTSVNSEKYVRWPKFERKRTLLKNRIFQSVTYRYQKIFR